jgi:hypothetical protein
MANGDLLNFQPVNGGGISGSRFKGRLVQTLTKGIPKRSATLPPAGSF